MRVDRPGWREAIEIEALRTDRYVESLLGGGGGQPAATTGAARVGPEPAVAEAVEGLRRDIVRVHPSFRFEERLARRLADLAAAMRLPAAAGAEGTLVPVIPFPGAFDATSTGTVELADERPDHPALDQAPAAGLSRPVLIGGAVASAALSLAGAAIVAWRLGRGAGDPVSRTVAVVEDLRAAVGASERG
jgi:hypothetical protein